MQVKVEKQPKSTLKVTVTVPSDQVREVYDDLLAETIKNADLPGFRKGTAPADLVKEKVDVSKLYGEVINSLLQKFYPRAVKENHIVPISNPRVEIKEFDLDKDFEFTALVAVRPEVKVGDYKKKVKELQEKRQKDIREQNAKKLAEGEKIEEAHVHLGTSDVIDAILDAAEAEVPELLVEDETERMMARLVDQAESVGLSLDQYLRAQNKTSDQLRGDYKKIAERNLKAEFVLSHLAAEEKIDVTDQELEDVVKASGVTDAEEQLKDPTQKWYIKSVLQKNKLINNLIEEVAHHE